MKVLFVGDPVLDVISHISDQVLLELGFAPGGCDHIEEDRLNVLLERSDIKADQKRWEEYVVHDSSDM